jgi:hypothetical protein
MQRDRPDQVWVPPAGTEGGGADTFWHGSVQSSLRCRACCCCPWLLDAGHVLRAQVVYRFVEGGGTRCFAAARKAASQEIVGANALLLAQSTHVHVALTALHAVRAYVIVATAAAPLSLDTVVIGCSSPLSAERIVHDGRRCPSAEAFIAQVTRCAAIALPTACLTL